VSKLISVGRKALQLTNSWRGLVLYGTVISLAAKTPALLPALSVDDYVSETFSPEFLVSQGRYGVILFLEASEFLNVTYYSTFFVGTPLSVFLWIVFLAQVGKYLKLKPNVQLLLAILVASLHPYMAEVLTFRIGTLPLSVSLILSTTIVYFFRRHDETEQFRYLPFAGVFVFILGLFYQSLLNFIAVVFLIKLSSIIITLRRKSDDRQSVRSVLIHVSTAGVSLGAYLAFNRFMQNLFGVDPTSRSILIDGEEVPFRVNQIVDLIGFVFLGDEPVLALGAKLIFWSIMAIYLLGLLTRQQRRAAGDVSPAALLAATSLLVVGFFMMVPGMIFPFSDWWPVPRVIAHTSLYFAAGVYMALMAVKGRKFNASASRGRRP
jgi:UPF0716 family protein affecting phage T7 exclusion